MKCKKWQYDKDSPTATSQCRKKEGHDGSCDYGELGKAVSTTVHGNRFYVYQYEKGAEIKHRGEKERFKLSAAECCDVVLDLREFAEPKCFTEPMVREAFENLRGSMCDGSLKCGEDGYPCDGCQELDKVKKKLGLNY